MAAANAHAPSLPMLLPQSLRMQQQLHERRGAGSHSLPRLIAYGLVRHDSYAVDGGVLRLAVWQAGPARFRALVLDGALGSWSSTARWAVGPRLHAGRLRGL